MVFQTVQSLGMCSAVYGTAQYKEPGQSRLRASFCRDYAMIVNRKRRKATLTHSPCLFEGFKGRQSSEIQITHLILG